MNNPNHHRIALYIIIGIVFTFLYDGSVLGQSAVRGNVCSQETGEPLFLCNVQIEGTDQGMVTDENGFFHFSRLDSSKFTLIISSIGFRPDTIHISLNPREIRSLQIKLKPSVNEIKEVVVNAASSQRKTEIQVSVQQISKRELESIPQIGAEPDLSQYLQSLPGFLSSGEQGGQLYIRGGSEVQNCFLLDEIPVFNPFHSLSLFSVIDSDILQSVSVYSGGYPSDLGGGISSVMDTKTRDGNLSNLAGKFSISTVGTGLAIEGPLAHKGFLQKTTFMLSAKTGLINKTAPVLYSYTGSSGTPYGFTDLFGKINRSGTNGNKISLTGFRFSDQVRLDSSLAYDWVNYGLGGNVVIVPERSNGLIRAALNYSSYQMKWQQGENESNRFSGISTFRILIESINYLGINELKIGMETSAMKSMLDYQNLFGYSLKVDMNTTDLGVYLKDKLQAGNLVLEAGIRGSLYTTSGIMIPEPRIGWKINLNSRLRIKGAAGYYSQNLVSVKSDQDVVNYFNGFILEPESITRNFGEKQAKNNIQTAWHLITGIETEPIVPLQINAEGYVKYFPQSISYNRNKRFNPSIVHSEVADIYTASFMVERGWAYGLDLLLKYSTGKFFSQLSYSLARVRLFDGLQTYYPHYDRRQNINVLASYNLGKINSPWEVNIHFSFGSGFPYTPITSYYGKIDLGDYETDAVLNDYDAYGILFGDTNSERLPVFHRLDMTIKHVFNLKKAGRLEASLSLFNAYDRNNIFYFDLSTYQLKYQLPILPVMGLKYSFQ